MTENAFIAAARGGQNGFWRYLATVLLVIALTFAPTSCLLTAVMVVARSPDLTALLPGPVFLAVNLLSFIFIPLGLWVGLRLLHHRPFMSIINPTGRLYWGRLWGAAGGWLILAALGDVVLSLIQPGNYAWTFDLPAFLPYLVVSVLLIPIQAGAEELLFRGYLTQGFGLLNFWLGWLVPAVLFGLLHGLNPEVGAYGLLLTMPAYIGMGLLLGWVTLRSESLEMALGMHIANNLYASLIVTFPNSALQTESLFVIQKYDPLAALIVFIVSALIFVAAFEAKRRRWWRKGAVLFLVCAALALSACSGGVGAAAQADPTPAPTAAQTGTPGLAVVLPPAPIALQDCTLEGTSIKAQCGTLEVPENRAEPEGRKISLNVVVVRAISRNPAPDPLFLLAGGPGQAATEAFTGLMGALEGIRQKRDLVMVDQRGTGKSGALSCTPPEPRPTPTPGVIRADPPLQESLSEIEACLERLEGVDLTQYTTDTAMQDLDDVRQALGYETINLLGVSYGTRAALAYLGLYPNQVRAVVLDGVAPLGWALGVTMRSDAQRALDLVFQRCEADAACRETFPNLKRELNDLLSAVHDSPREVTTPDPWTGQPRRVSISPLLISSTVRLMTYHDSQAALIPLMIHQAAEGDFTMLVSQYLQLIGSLDQSLAVGMYFSVWCYEDLPLLPPGGELGDYYFDPDLKVSREICQRWPPINRSVEIPETTNTDVPLLMISGEADPVTPPANAELAAHGMTNSLHLILPGMGHSNFYAGCMPTIIRDFLDRAAVEGLETGCLQNITPQSFFLSPVGPMPLP